MPHKYHSICPACCSNRCKFRFVRKHFLSRRYICEGQKILENPTCDCHTNVVPILELPIVWMCWIVSFFIPYRELVWYNSDSFKIWHKKSRFRLRKKVSSLKENG